MSTQERMVIVGTVRAKYRSLGPNLNERTRRLWAATEAHAIGRGGATIVTEAIGVSRTTVWSGHRELLTQETVGATAVLPPHRIRKRGGGKKSITERDPTICADLDRLVEPTTRGDPTAPLRWTTKSTRMLRDALREQGHTVTSPQTISNLLHALGYTLQSTKQAHEGRNHPDRDAQFRYIIATVTAIQQRNQPVISVDTKKKELVGDFKQSGREWHRKGQPERVRMHDFVDPKLGKVIPYGVYDLSENAGWVSVGIDHDTADFAVASIRRWWGTMGKHRYPAARELCITADGGGSNGYRLRRWKVNLQAFADATDLAITVRHFPPGTSKWNKIEHRLFSFITKNWRGRPLLDRATVIELIASTRTKTGLRVRAELDTHAYPIGMRVSDEDLAAVNLTRDDFHGEWNYTITPQPV